MRILYLMGQVIVIYAIYLLGAGIVSWLHIPIPGSLIGLLILFLLLRLNFFKEIWFARGAKWLIGELLLFFVPSAVGIVQYGNIVKSSGIQILVVIACSTCLVMIVTGVLTETLVKRAKKAGE